MRGSSISELTEIPEPVPELEVLEEQHHDDLKVEDDECLLEEVQDGKESAGKELLQFMWESRIDWAAFIVLLGLAIVGALLTPYAFSVNEQLVQDYMYPYRHNAVPLPGVLAIAIGSPLLFSVCFFAWRRNAADLHQSCLGALFALVITSLTTDCFRVLLGWPKPNFATVCFPSGTTPSYDASGSAQCTGTSSAVAAARGSFPNRESSMAFAGLMFSAFFLAGKLHTFDQNRHFIRLVPSVVLFAIASGIAVNRVNDSLYTSSPLDAFAAAIVGTAWASLFYFLRYPKLTSKNCDEPLCSLLIRPVNLPKAKFSVTSTASAGTTMIMRDRLEDTSYIIGSTT